MATQIEVFMEKQATVYGESQAQINDIDNKLAVKYAEIAELEAQKAKLTQLSAETVKRYPTVAVAREVEPKIVMG